MIPVADQRHGNVRPRKNLHTEIEDLLQCAEALLDENNDKALEIVEQALKSAEQFDWRAGIAKGLWIKSKVFLSYERYIDIVAIATEGLALAQEIGDAPLQYQFHRLLGSAYRFVGRNEDALEHLLIEIAICESSGDNAGLADAALAASSNYLLVEDAENAIKFASQAASLFQKLEDTVMWADALRHFGIAYAQKLHQPQTGLRYYYQALDLLKEKNEEHVIKYAFILNDIGIAYGLIGKYEKCADYFHENLVIMRTLNNIRGQSIAHYSLGRLHLQTCQELETGVRHFQQAITLAESINDTRTQYECLQHLANCYKQLGNMAEALKCLETSFELYRKVNTKESNDKLQLLTVQYDVDKAKRAKEAAEKDKQVAEQNQEIFRLKNVELANALNEVRTLNQKLVESNAEKNEVIDIVAHDLKSPLAGVRTVATVVKERHKQLASEQLEQQLDIIEGTSRRMLAVVNNLLDVKALEGGKRKLETSQVNVAELIAVLTASMNQTAKNKDVDLRACGEDDVIALADRNALTQAIENLMSNALKFSPPGSTVSVRYRRCDGEVYIEVEDQGPGISEEDRKDLFQKYARLSAQPTGGERSTGLGLWIVKELIAAMLGNVECRNAAQGGAIFIIRLQIPNSTFDSSTQ